MLGAIDLGGSVRAVFLFGLTLHYFIRTNPAGLPVLCSLCALPTGTAPCMGINLPAVGVILNFPVLGFLRFLFLGGSDVLAVR